jgi:hypothetical protein
MPNENGLRQCRSPLLEGLSLMCADPVSALGRLPQKSFVRAIVTCHVIVKEKTARNAECSRFSRHAPAGADDRTAARPDRVAAFSRLDAPDKERTRRRPIVSADGISRRPRIARTRGGADPSAEPAASWSSRFGS